MKLLSDHEVTKEKISVKRQSQQFLPGGRSLLSNQQERLFTPPAGRVYYKIPDGMKNEMLKMSQTSESQTSKSINQSTNFSGMER